MADCTEAALTLQVKIAFPHSLKQIFFWTSTRSSEETDQPALNCFLHPCSRKAMTVMVITTMTMTRIAEVMVMVILPRLQQR